MTPPAVNAAALMKSRRFMSVILFFIQKLTLATICPLRGGPKRRARVDAAEARNRHALGVPQLRLQRVGGIRIVHRRAVERIEELGAHRECSSARTQREFPSEAELLIGRRW